MHDGDGDHLDAMAVAAIGRVRTGHTDRSTTPVQSALNPTEQGRVELDVRYREGLDGLEGFDFAWLLTWLAAAPGDTAPAAMRQVPFLLGREGREIGLFAMRGPRRPNPIGLHLVRVVAVHDDGFTFGGVDMLDGTPLLDVKPWVNGIDLPHGRGLAGSIRSGWFDAVALDAPDTPASLRAAPRRPPPTA